MQKKGFTLIEMMLVVIIIGVLAAMVMPRLAGRSEQARVSAAKADINANIAMGLDMFEAEFGYYPEQLQDLRVNPGLGDKWKGPYLKKDPRDPWGREYEYERTGGGGAEYKLCSKGSDENKPEGKICNE